MRAPQSFARRSIATVTLIKAAALIALLLLAINVVRHYYVVRFAASQQQDQLKQYIHERRQVERRLFRQAETNIFVSTQYFLRELPKTNIAESSARFDKLFEKNADGAWRNREPGFDSTNAPNTFIGPQAKLDDAGRTRIVFYHDLAARFGPAWHNRFPNFYVMGEDNVIANYWPEVRWAKQATTNLYIPDEIYYADTTIKKNPTRKIIWTDIYYDAVADDWMTSGVGPVDVSGRQIAAIGHDMLLSELIHRTTRETLPETWNVLFTRKGNLVAHASLMNKVKAAQGNFSVTNSPEIQRIYDLVIQFGLEEGVVVHPDTQDLLAVAKLNEPDWYMVVV